MSSNGHTTSFGDLAVSVRGLSKAYTIAHDQEKHNTLAETMLARLRNPLSRGKTETFWALKDISFDIKKGSVVGIIGRNGAGKSTLLKILSRITEPTAGEIRLYGRVGSLLEVGTGFHSELTGRENIFLNGAILGMSKGEIRKQFDAIVDFAGVDQFLDTPVKRYSSGMYVRLAFAVAANLNSEILIVDEVLAVGDSEFQKKCLGKMKDVSSGGRTVLFVSHNMEAILRLCDRCILLQGGRVVSDDAPRDVVKRYAETSASSGVSVVLDHRARPPHVRNGARIVALSTPRSSPPWSYEFGGAIVFRCEIVISISLCDLKVAYAIFTPSGAEIASTVAPVPSSGSLEPATRLMVDVEIEQFSLVPGTYRLNLGLHSSLGQEDFIADAVTLEVASNEVSAQRGSDRVAALTSPTLTITEAE